MPQLTGNIVDLIRREIYPGTVTIADGRIARIDRFGNTPADDSRHNGSLPFLLPGFIDSHVHIESSMLSPALYGHTALGHGTVAIVADPHEIANVCGTDGIRYMVEQARRTPLKIHYTVPSCVPATPFETSGATLDSRTVEELLESGVFVALGEMMNYPGVLGGDDQCIRKIEAARRRGIPVDGHAPLLEGADLRRYIGTGISTDHESCSLREAREKIDVGMMIQIREGSQSREFDTLIPLLGYRPDRVMLCTDDLKASGLSRGHINRWLAANCFGDYYTRTGLTLSERELITFCFLMAQGGCEPQLIAHSKGNMNMGNDKDFLIRVVSGCLPYIGYPRSLNAIACINKAVEE